MTRPNGGGLYRKGVFLLSAALRPPLVLYDKTPKQHESLVELGEISRIFGLVDI